MSVDAPSAPRILLCGDVCGRLSTLFKRVASVNKSNGPFHALFCVGQFFPNDLSGTEEVQKYVDGTEPIPLPTYFIGDYGEGAGLILSTCKAKAARTGLSMEGIPVCENLTWLIGSGILNLHGLRIAYLGGKFNASLYQDAKGAAAAGAHHEDDVDALRAFAEDKAVTDLFLSNEWPKGVTAGGDLIAVPQNVDRSTGTAVAADLATELKPRYHIAGTEGVFYAREPYLNPGAKHATRFIGLAAVGNDKKQKFLHALSPTPASVMAPSELSQRPPVITLSPYELIAGLENKNGENRVGNGAGRDSPHTGKHPGDSESQYWRYDVSNSKRQRRDDGDRVCVEFVTRGTCSREGNCRFKHDLGDGTPIPKGACFEFVTKGKCEKGADCRYRHSLENAPAPRPPSGPCWFCLSSPDVGTHLVVSVGDHCYCALAKGPVVQGHVLILPIEHFPSTVCLSADTLIEMQKYVDAIRECHKRQGNAVVIFERYIQLRAGTHAHLQIIPIPQPKVQSAREAFVSAANQAGFEFQNVPSGRGDDEARRSLKEIVQGRNYFFVELPDRSMLVHPLEVGAKMSMQFGREVVATLLGKPERGDWKACPLSKDEETDMAEEFKEQFSSFDPMT